VTFPREVELMHVFQLWTAILVTSSCVAPEHVASFGPDHALVVSTLMPDQRLNAGMPPAVRAKLTQGHEAMVEAAGIAAGAP
jgi:hypothetical protein